MLTIKFSALENSITTWHEKAGKIDSKNLEEQSVFIGQPNNNWNDQEKGDCLLQIKNILIIQFISENTEWNDSSGVKIFTSTSSFYYLTIM